jgi:MFS family permease
MAAEPTVGDPAVRRGRLAASGAFFAQGYGFAVVLTHLAAFKTRWDLDDLAITVVMFLVALLAAGGSLLAAWLAARWGSGAALRFGLLGLAAGLLVAALSGAFPVFCVGIGLYGIALGCVDASSNMQAVACEALQGRSILTSFHGAWSAGGILGALTTSGTASLGWSLPASLGPVAAIPLIAAVAPFLTASESRSGRQLSGTAAPAPGGPPGTGTQPSAADGLRAPAAPGAVPSIPGSGPSLTIPWRALTLLGLAIVLFYVADSATSSWSTIYLRDVLLASGPVAPLGYAAYQATSLLSRLAGDHLVRRTGPVPVVRAAALIAAAGLVAVVLARQPWLAVAGFAVLGIGIAVVAPLTFSAAGRLAARMVGPDADQTVRRSAADAVIARLNQFNYLGFVLGGVLTGLVASGSTMRQGFLVPLVGICLIVPLARVFAARPGSPSPAVVAALPGSASAPLRSDGRPERLGRSGREGR